MAILTKPGRAAIAKKLKESVSFLAIGEGGGTAWDTSIPPDDANANALIAEIGRRKATSIEYVVPDDSGLIEIPGAGKFLVSPTPTRQLLYTFNFSFDDAPAATIRELGIFINVAVDPMLPAGQMYFEPSQIVESGDMLHLEHRAPIVRSASTREILNLLVTI